MPLNSTAHSAGCMIRDWTQQRCIHSLYQLGNTPL